MALDFVLPRVVCLKGFRFRRSRCDFAPLWLGSQRGLVGRDRVVDAPDIVQLAAREALDLGWKRALNGPFVFRHGAPLTFSHGGEYAPFTPADAREQVEPAAMDGGRR